MRKYQFPFDRKIDELGRVVIPIEVRNNLKWNGGDSLTLCLDMENNCVILYKKEPETNQDN